MYPVAMSSSAAFSAASAVLAWVLRWMLIRENRKIRASNNEERLFYAYWIYQLISVILKGIRVV